MQDDDARRRRAVLEAMLTYDHNQNYDTSTPARALAALVAAVSAASVPLGSYGIRGSEADDERERRVRLVDEVVDDLLAKPEIARLIAMEVYGGSERS